MPRLLSSDVPLAPIVGGSGARVPQRLTGTSSQSNSTALVQGSFATLLVSSDTAVAVRFAGSSGTAVSTDVEIPASGRFDWYVESDSTVISVIAADGSSTFECWVWQSS